MAGMQHVPCGEDLDGEGGALVERQRVWQPDNLVHGNLRVFSVGPAAQSRHAYAGLEIGYVRSHRFYLARGFETGDLGKLWLGQVLALAKQGVSEIDSCRAHPDH